MDQKVKEKEKYQYSVGRRKKTSARVRLFKGKGADVVNGKPVEEMSLSVSQRANLYMPFVVAGVEGEYHFSAKMRGGGKIGQVEAVRLGLARALSKTSEDIRKKLRKEGLLTRDSRVKERKKIGKLGARKSPQYSKR